MLQDELREKNQLLETISVTDPLTGLFNGRHLMTRLEEELARTVRYENPLSVVMIDLDHFKQVNDHYGRRWATRCCAPWGGCSRRPCAPPTWRRGSAAKS